MISVFSAAKTLCQMSGWTLSNLKLQKIIYLAYLYHLGRTGHPLFDGKFEAWDYGPVEPELFRKVRLFGSGHIENIFYGIDEITKESHPDEFRSIEFTYSKLKDFSAGSLVGVTHWEKGAWAKVYDPYMDNLPITDKLILDEYNERTKRS